MRSDIIPGGVFPDYALPDHTGTVRMLSKLQGHSVYNSYWFWGRPSVDDLGRDLRAATSDSRPDWDLSTPGLREAWATGDRSPFHGWDRRSREPLTAT
jgi:hypothetical protein